MIYLTLLAILPIIFLCKKIYKLDTKESEPVSLLFKIFLFGCLSIIPAIILEIVVLVILSMTMDVTTIQFIMVENFVGVALIEECCKYTACKFASFKHKAFNYTFDGVVYCVVSALGFACIENIMYVFQYGFQVAIVRAFLAIPGHTIFGIVMGYYYTKVKQASLRGASTYKYTLLALLVPTCIHGTYDALLSLDTSWALQAFIAFIFIIDVWAYRFTKKLSQNDSIL